MDPSTPREKAILELKYAVIATGITLVCAVALYLYVPYLQEQMRERDEELLHSREFVTQPTGGEIVYALPEDMSDGADATLKNYRQDLEILSRRFQRGDFAMTTLPGMKQSPEYANMVSVGDALQYTVNERDRAIVLTIRANNPRAVQYVHDYLAYLKSRWEFKRHG